MSQQNQEIIDPVEATRRHASDTMRGIDAQAVAEAAGRPTGLGCLRIIADLAVKLERLTREKAQLREAIIKLAGQAVTRRPFGIGGQTIDANLSATTHTIRINGIDFGELVDLVNATDSAAQDTVSKEIKDV